MLTPNQLDELLSILDKQFLFFTTTHLGPDYLSGREKRMLSDSGIDWKELYNESKDPIVLNFQLGLISNVIGERKAKGLEYKELKNIIQSGQYIKPNARERATLQSIKMQSLGDIKRLRGRIFDDINQVGNQEAFIRREIEEGLERRQGVKSIVQNLGRKSGDWSRDFSKMVEYISHKALTEGRVAMMRRKGGEDQKIYFEVYPGACSHCVKHYLTGGLGSEPRVFTIKQLEANGTNIGRKQKDWKPTFSPLHPFCRCNAHEYEEGSVWDKEEKRWIEREYQPRIERPKVKVTVAGQEYMV